MIVLHKKLSEKWMIRSSGEITQGGAEIATPGYRPVGWYPAEVPSTVLATLVKNGVYKDLYVGMTMAKVPTEQFRVPWWYRNEFELTAEEAEQTVLVSFDGINYN